MWVFLPLPGTATGSIENTATVAIGMKITPPIICVG